MHLIEFMDQKWLPKSLQCTLRDILECGNRKPFRSYYEETVEYVLEEANAYRCRTIWELGAGTAPLTQHMLERDDCSHLKFGICDRNPDTELYQELADQHEGRVSYYKGSLDFKVLPDDLPWRESDLLVLSATLHHISKEERNETIANLTADGNPFVVSEPLRNSFLSVLYTFLSLIPALYTPVRFFGRPGTLRRIAWCWVLPVAPILFIWDGIVSCIRQWRESEWLRQANLNGFCQLRTTRGRHDYFLSLRTLTSLK